AERLSLDAAAGTLTLRGTLSESDRDALAGAFGGEGGDEVAKTLYERVAEAERDVKRLKLSHPSYLATPFSVPVLSIKQGDLWEPFEQSHFHDAGWDLGSCDPRLTREEWSPGAG